VPDLQAPRVPRVRRRHQHRHDQTSFNLLFDADIDYPEATQDWPKPEDFVLTRNATACVAGAPDPPGPGQQRGVAALPEAGHALHLDTHDVIEDGDIVTVEMLDSGAAKLLPYGRNSAPTT
jgi:hypothetical protein